MPDATAAADPPLEPLVLHVVSHGLAVAPNRTGSHDGDIPNSGVFVLPTITRPARRRRATNSESNVATLSRRNREPSQNRVPSTSAARSFIRYGPPTRGMPPPPAGSVA